MTQERSLEVITAQLKTISKSLAQQAEYSKQIADALKNFKKAYKDVTKDLEFDDEENEG